MGHSDNRWQRFWYGIKEWLRFLDRDRLPERLREASSPRDAIVCDMMLRSLAVGNDLGFKIGISKLVGLEIGKQFTSAWRPRDLFLLERIAVAFEDITELLQQGVIPNDLRQERLSALLAQWNSSHNPGISNEQVAQEVAAFIARGTTEFSRHENEGPRRIHVDHPLLDELYEVEESIDLHVPGIERATTFDEIGLMLAHPLGAGRYGHCTPMNCTVFARTGGDGVHYSLLERDGKIDADSPVVMTMPAYCTFIVGETLHDFLSLGLEWGYFSIEQIGYDEKELSLYLEGHPDCDPERLHSIADCMNPVKRKVLDLLQARFELRPWTDPEHWQRLQEKYMPLLHLPPNF